MNIFSIIPNRLYAGGALDAAGWSFVARHIHAVIDLREVVDIPPFNFTERLLLWTPILDKKAPELHWVITVTGLMNVLLDAGYVMYVHDTAGINRLGFILTAFFMQKYGYSRDAALAVLRQIKPDLNPKPHYMALLALYEDYLNKCCRMEGDEQ